MHNTPEDLIGQNIVVFDCEIINVIDNKTITWNDHHKMGISVAVAFDYKNMEYKVFLEDNLGDFVSLLNRADMISGFNILGFDIPLVIKTPPHGKDMKREFVHYDMLFFSRLSTGWTPGARFPTGLRLDNHLESTFGKDFMKTEDGANAPILWQQKKYGRVIDYCLADVKREKTLFEHIWKGLPVKTAAHGTKTLVLPQTVLKEA